MRLRLSLIALLGCLACAPLQAQQYRSEVRVLDEVPRDQTPKNPEQLLRQADSAYERALLLREMAGRAASNKQFDKAADYLGRAIQQNALSPQAQRAMQSDLSKLLVASGDPDAIIRGLEDSVRGNRDASPAQRAALGAAYVAKKRFRQGLPLLEQAVRESPEPEENWLRALLAAQIELKRTQDAARTVDRLLVRNPREGDYWRQAVALHRNNGDNRDAQAALEVAARLGFVSTPEQRRQLVGLMAQIGAPYYAATQLEDWLESGAVDRSLTVLRERASYWLAARESEPAINAIRDVLARSTDVGLLMQLGQLHMDQEAYGQAAQVFERALQARPGNGEALMALAVSRYQQADVEGALKAFKQASQIEAHAKLASDWVEYLESGRAREQAMQARARRAERQGDARAELERAVLGEAMTLEDEAQAVAGTRGAGGLTPVGAEAGPSADGVIPAWTGGITPDQWPEGYAEGEQLVDPFATDQPKATITADNMAQYSAYLSDGHKALLQRYASYRMPLYPTRRSVSYPERIYKATRDNAERARLIGSDSLSGAFRGFPFREPDSGVEAMWNHRVRYRGDSIMVRSEQAVVQTDGDVERRLFQTERVYFRYANLEDPVDIDQQNILLYYLSWFARDPTGVDFLALVHETANAADKGRALWVLPERANRLFRIPPVGYDQPFPGSGGIYFVDMIDMYNGAFDRYNWRLIGKRQLIVPYNNFGLINGSVEQSRLLQGKHPDPSAMRYERHRVWVVEATERPGKSHSFGKRIFYIDEDSWNVVLVENYDEEGDLWRFQEGHLVPLYNVQAANAMPVVTYNFPDGRYFINRLVGHTEAPQYDVPGISAGDYLPSRVKARYAR